MRFRGALSLALMSIFMAHPCRGQRTDSAVSSQQSLDRFLRDYLGPASTDEGLTQRYFSAFVDLRDDQTREAIVYIMEREWCGSGGCTTLILAPEGSSYRIVTKISVSRPPIRILSTKSNGWHDLGVWVQGGGVQPGYEAKLRFDGKSYPRNPSVAPAQRLVETVGGEVVVPKTVGLPKPEEPATPPAPNQDSRSGQNSCRDFTQKFYDWYLPNTHHKEIKKNGKGALEFALEKRRSAFDPDLVRQLEHGEAKAKVEGEPFLDFDPVLNSQDPAPQYSVEKVTLKANHCWADVYGVWPTQKNEKPDAVCELSLRDEQWFFVDFHYPDSEYPNSRSLLRTLRFLRKKEESHSNENLFREAFVYVRPERVRLRLQIRRRAKQRRLVSAAFGTPEQDLSRVRHPCTLSCQQRVARTH